MRLFTCAMPLGLALLIGCSDSQPSHGEGDNTAINQRDRSGTTLTPLDQSEDASDIQTTAAIRQRVVDLPGMSVDGQNAKIITVAGQVTLRGPVDSEEERAAIEKIAKAVAGVNRVDNQLDVIAK